MAEQDLCLEHFRGRSERWIKQDPLASCMLITLTRPSANRSEGDAREESARHEERFSGHPGRVGLQSRDRRRRLEVHRNGDPLHAPEDGAVAAVAWYLDGREDLPGCLGRADSLSDSESEASGSAPDEGRNLSGCPDHSSSSSKHRTVDSDSRT